MLTSAEKTDVRRFCGYPALGSSATGFDSWRFTQYLAVLEHRMDHLAPEEEAVLRRHLGELRGLELSVPRAGENLDTDQAAVWTRNRTEPGDRTKLFDDWRRRLCAFLGIPPGPGLPNGTIRLVV